ncbi:hypothetical protein IFM89_019009 [Coptis chinensis]|uniref:Reverse transcriptase zinc-binding domain-containing protein n=1 Tax=Coptis chinensis TaxID=261450 RepID=A0A835I262_9MAGN|nr:hypothetical protein IFM89_019009 [Coptis chinensis]
MLWNSYICPRTAALAWKLCHKVAATEPSAQRKGVKLASMCPCCRNNVEEITNLLWECSHAKKLWDWVSNRFHVQHNFNSLPQAKAKMKNGRTLLSHIWNAAIIGGLVGLWKHRNRMIFEARQEGIFGFL